MLDREKQIRADIAQRFDTEEARGFLTLLAAGVVFAVYQTAFHIGIDDHHRDIFRHRYCAGFQRSAVDQQSMIPFAERRNQLIHNPAVTADKLVLCFLPIEGQRYAIQRQSIQCLHGLTNGDFQRGGRTEAGTLWHITGNHQVRTAKIAVALLQVFDHAAYVIGPALGWMADDRFIERKQILLGVVIGGDHPDLTVVAFGAGDHRLVIDGARQHKTVVIVGMLTDQVHPARGLDSQCGRVAKTFGKKGVGKVL
ncbi:hypothetical protein D3C72_1271270 [compost metagenome]